MASLQHPWLSSSLTRAHAFFPSTNPLGPSSSKPLKVSFSQNQSEPRQDSPPPNSPESTAENDPVKLALGRAKAYKKLKEEQKPNANLNKDGGEDFEKEVTISVKIAIEKAKEYKKNKGIAGDYGDDGNAQLSSGCKNERVVKLNNEAADRKDRKQQELKVSSLDFVGLNFADKRRTRGLPPGLAPVSDPFYEGNSPEVEIIVGDTTRFEEATITAMPEEIQEETADVYKPKVSTWGVFPRPNNISKTMKRAAKEERTRQLLAAYKEKVGLKVDPRLKSECEKALKDGDTLMDSGKLKEALRFYEKVMEKMTFKSELHGLAALQWSICQDSLRRTNEARVMYEKLQSHPNAQVSKKARQFLFSFQAMEMMKVNSSSLSISYTGYQNYFDAFVKDKLNYTQEIGVEDESVSQTLPYLIFLLSPVFLVLYIAVQKGNLH